MRNKMYNNINNFHFDGTIEMTENIEVTDPCYDKDVWCRLNVKNCVPGTYQCYNNFDPDERRIMQSMIIHQDFVEDFLNTKEKEIGSIGVDAGLAGFFKNKPNFSDEAWQKFCLNVMWKVGNFYSEKESKGYFTESGYGDGVYPVYAHVKNNKVFALRIDFR